jgi:hypothetical protein
VDLDPSYKALIFFQLPNQDFRLFGSVSSAKPSAIFKLNNTVSQTSLIMDDGEMDMDAPSDPLDNITVGISIEPAIEADRQLEAVKYVSSQPKQITATAESSKISPLNPNKTAILAGNIVKNAYNYLTGFVDNDGKVSIKYFDTWWDKFRTRLQNDPKFLDNEQD